MASTRCLSQVLMGGGRRHWLPLTDFDREERNQRGRRTDGRNLLDDWVRDKKTRDLNAEYVWNKAQFDKVDPRHTDYLLGKASSGGENNGILIILFLYKRRLVSHGFLDIEFLMFRL